MQPQQRQFRSGFYMIVPQAPQPQAPQPQGASSEDEETNKNTTGDTDKFVLKSVSPLFLPVSRAVWDFGTLHCAVQIRNRINVLRVQEASGGGSVLRTVGSSSLPLPAVTLSWLPNSGLLFASTVTDLFLIVTDYPFSLGVTEEGEVERRDLSQISQLDISDNIVDLLHVATTSHTRQGQTCGQRYLHTKPEGVVEVVGVRGSTLVLCTAEGNFSGLSLVQPQQANLQGGITVSNSTSITASNAASNFSRQGYNPLLVCAVALGFGVKGDQLVDLLKDVPLCMHDR